MKVFERITQSPDELAKFLSADKDNGGCSDCEHKEQCTGREFCISKWVETLTEEV